MTEQHYFDCDIQPQGGSISPLVLKINNSIIISGWCHYFINHKNVIAKGKILVSMGDTNYKNMSSPHHSREETGLVKLLQQI